APAPVAEPIAPAIEPDIEADEDIGPAPYEGPGEETHDEDFEAHEPTMTPEMEKRRAQRAFRAKLLLGVNVVGLVAMVWVVLGLLRRIGVMPGLDLGYTWFNDSIFRMF
ncbi:MAG: hypothetical protein Q4E65_07405, partial [Clostridia bacterium]|nr:hypothetical protein [Clostridia bacterium]